MFSDGTWKMDEVLKKGLNKLIWRSFDEGILGSEGAYIPQIISYSSFLNSGIHLGVQKRKILILDFGEKG